MSKLTGQSQKLSGIEQVTIAKEQVRNLKANANATKEAENREKLTKLKMKVEAFCVTKGCSWMMEFLDTSCMTEYQFQFIVPEHRDIFLRMGGSHGSGQWIVDTGEKGWIEKSFTSIGEALIAAENKA